MGDPSHQEFHHNLSGEIHKLSPEEYPKEAYICEKLHIRFLKNKCILPVSLDDNILSLIVDDPDDVETFDVISLTTGFKLKLFKGERDDILEAIDRCYESDSAAVNDIVEDITSSDSEARPAEEDDVDHLRDMASEAPVIRLVNLIITRAVESKASDIHIEPFESIMRVRYRVDDILREVESLPKRLHPAVTSRVKIMASLNIAERRLPQDGRIKIAVSGRDVDMRVATMPTAYGESIVLRILDRGSLVLTLEELGLSSEKKLNFEKMISRPYGMILVTGPTGSGKTTTLYTTLEKLNTPKKKIVTIEEPIEYHLHGINQIQVKPQIGLTFANGLRHIVRLDPNIIMVGEIRDRETAEIAVQSALTGHLVFSTLHTNDAAGAIARLLEMGVADYLLASSLIGIIAQRLVRIICNRCKTSYRPEGTELGLIKGWDSKTQEEPIELLYRGQGCDECGYSGYRGRKGIFEVLPVQSEIRQLILKKPESGAIKDKAMELGMMTLREDGLRKITEGITTIEEVIRVTQED